MSDVKGSAENQPGVETMNAQHYHYTPFELHFGVPAGVRGGIHHSPMESSALLTFSLHTPYSLVGRHPEGVPRIHQREHPVGERVGRNAQVGEKLRNVDLPVVVGVQFVVEEV